MKSVFEFVPDPCHHMASLAHNELIMENTWACRSWIGDALKSRRVMFLDRCIVWLNLLSGEVKCCMIVTETNFKTCYVSAFINTFWATLFTRGQFWPSGIAVACVFLCVCVSVRPFVFRASVNPWEIHFPLEKIHNSHDYIDCFDSLSRLFHSLNHLHVHWSRQPRVFRRLTSLLLTLVNTLTPRRGIEHGLYASYM